MNYFSTRDTSLSRSSAEAIARGLSRDGGLFIPMSIPTLSEETVSELCKMTYPERAARIMGMYLEDYSAEELAEMTKAAYGANFDAAGAAPLHETDEKTSFLELWHGPTCAFKDIALQILPRYLTSALRKTGEEKNVCILVATSGDTGKAALEGFRDVEGTKILVFYPRDGVSDVQKLQMQTQEGKNVSVCSVAGNFDDAQTGVKTIFSDEELRGILAQNGWFLSSANSINWGRLLPQIVYYISSYCDLMNNGRIRYGEKIHFCVPTGNFGDILAGYFARCMGLPVGKLICASNRNDVLTEFIRTGVYNKNRPFYTTTSPSMDILVSSNLERLLFDLSGKNAEEVKGYMEKLKADGTYTVSDALAGKIRDIFEAGCCDDEGTKKTIGEMWKQHGYLIDTHTAVAYRVLEDYRARTGDMTQTVVVSTASPFKFSGAVLEGIGVQPEKTGLRQLVQLEEVTGLRAPEPLRGLGERQVRFTECTEKYVMRGVVEQFLM